MWLCNADNNSCYSVMLMKTRVTLKRWLSVMRSPLIRYCISLKCLLLCLLCLFSKLSSFSQMTIKIIKGTVSWDSGGIVQWWYEIILNFNFYWEFNCNLQGDTSSPIYIAAIPLRFQVQKIGTSHWRYKDIKLPHHWGFKYTKLPHHWRY